MKVLLGNILSLIFVQFSNYLAPLLVLPFLARVFSVEQFGLCVMLFSLCAILMNITDFGFNLSGPYRLAKQKQDADFLATYVSQVLWLKSLIATALVVLLFVSETGLATARACVK